MKDYTNNPQTPQQNKPVSVFKKIPLIYWVLDLIGVALIAAGIIILLGNDHILPTFLQQNGIMMIISGVLLTAPLMIKSILSATR